MPQVATKMGGTCVELPLLDIPAAILKMSEKGGRANDR
jgi:chemotaxis response regulator CheB